jgi:predicted membrane protein
VFVSLCGNTVVDFRDSNLPEGSSLSLIIVMLCGDVKLYVQRGTQVKVCRVMLCGDKESDEEGRFESSIKISVYILGLCGSVIVSNSPEDAK